MPDRGEAVRRAIAIAIWLGLMLGVGPLATLVTPAETRAKVPYQTFLMGSQIAILVLGLGATVLIVRRRRDALGLHVPGVAKLAATLAAAPITFVVSSFVALQIALPTLLEELKTRGANASAQNAGAFGQALQKPPLLVALLWGALLAALGEELFFRGLFWSTIHDLTRGLLPAPAPASDPRAQLTIDSPYSSPASVPAPAPALRDRALGVLFDGGIATLLSAALFGYLHKDLPGGVGIVRFWSTTLLGFASGVVRRTTGSVIACVLLHTIYNTIVIGSGKRWFSSAKDEPVLEGIPNSLLLLAVLGLIALGVIAFVRALAARRARSAFIVE